MFKKTVFLILSFSAMLLAAGGSQANTILMEAYVGTGPDRVTCNGGSAVDACFGIYQIGSSPPTLNNERARPYTPVTNPDSELALLNTLLANMDPTVAAVSGVGDPSNLIPDITEPGNFLGFTTNKEYFAIKQSTSIFYFKNTSGGELTVALTDGTASFSHATEFGAVVPVPAAVWLFGSGLLGLIGVARRRKV